MRATFISVYTHFSSCLLANMRCGPESHQPLTGLGWELARCSAGAGAARIEDKKSMLTDLLINLKTLIETVDVEAEGKLL